MTDRTTRADVLRARGDVYLRAMDRLLAERDAARAVLRRYTDLIDLDARAYTEKYGATTFADAVDDFVQAARAVLAGRDPTP